MFKKAKVETVMSKDITLSPRDFLAGAGIALIGYFVLGGDARKAKKNVLGLFGRKAKND